MAYGSFQNHCLGRHGRSDEPAVGMGATEVGWTDRHAFVIEKVCTPRKLQVARCLVTRLDKNGMSEAQQYAFEAPEFDAPAQRETIRQHKDGRWYSKGGSTFVVGLLSEYYDFSF